MIYIFSSCGKCAEACKCSSFCHECSVWFQKPLMFYAFLAVVLSGAEIVLCGFAICHKIEDSCEVPDDALGAVVAEKLTIRNSLYIHMGFAWLNMIFGPYIQYRLFQELKQEAREGHTAEDVADDEVDLSSKRVMHAFKDVFKYDIGICLYVFALFLSLGWSILLSAWASADSDCNPKGYMAYTAHIGIGFFAFVVVYAICWWVYLHCVSTMEVHGVGQIAQGVAAAAVATKSPAAAKYLQPKQANARVDTPPENNDTKKGMLGGLFSKTKTEESDNSKQPLNAYGKPLPRSGTQASSSSNGRAPDTERAPQRKKSMIAAKLMASMALDAMGSASYAAPGLGEGTDIAYAPAQAIALKMLYGSNTVATVGFLEEILPGTDIVPSGMIAWGVDTFAPNNALMRSSTNESNRGKSSNDLGSNKK